ncbi:hypothetical protein K438DRAFT_159925 [Mycena galopus ATCC 62051]|nr:hypothetical protein K438DRAFT_159925 [Mycena galopus ATCC 62051]
MESADGSPPAISPPYWPGPNLVAIAAFGPARVGLLAAKQNNARGLLESVPADWPPFDFSGVVLPTDYPPLPPVFLDADASILTAALTDVSCRIQFGSAVQFDQRYKWLGYQLCRAALAVLATQTLPSTASADLDAIRTECQAQSVFARLGLLFGLDKYVYRIRRADDSSAVGLALVAGSFRSLVAAVYVQFGWKRLLSWLEPLFNPWIRAAADGRLQESIGAKSQRRARRLDQQESQEATKRKKQKALQQLRLPDAGTTGVQRGAVTAARDTYRANPPVPRHGLIRHHPKPPRVHT